MYEYYNLPIAGIAFQDASGCIPMAFAVNAKGHFTFWFNRGVMCKMHKDALKTTICPSK